MKKTGKELRKKESIKIVPMSPVDIREIKRIEIESGLSVWSEADYLEELERKDSVVLTARTTGGEIIGFLVSRLIIQDDLADYKLEESLNTKREVNQGEIEIYNLAVKEPFRRNRVGEKLLFECLERGRERKVKECWLEVRKSNIAAIEFYRRAGFSVIYKRKDFYREPCEDALVMRLVFENNE